MSSPSFIQVTNNAPELVRELHKVEGAFQKVVAATLTETAKAVTTRSERNLKRTMIIRTTYTPKSLKTYPASATKPLARQNAVSGTISPYLPIQDEGGKISAKKKRIAVPTNRVRGKDRKKKIPGKYRLNNAGAIQWERPYAKGAKFFALYPALADIGDEKNWGKKKSRGKAAYRRYETFGRKRGKKMVAYRLSRPGIFTRQGKKLIKIRDVSVRQVTIHAKHWHSEAVKTYGNYQFMARWFRLNAKKYLAGKLD